jgi:hypothetical protein
MDTMPRTSGRPRRDPKPGERVKLGLRVTPELKQQLDTAAERSGRSQSQEAEFRLESSFERASLLPDVARMTFGELGAIVVLAGYAMDRAGRHAEWVVSQGKNAQGDAWLSDARAYDVAVKAAVRILEAFRPKGEVKPIAGPMPSPDVLLPTSTHPHELLPHGIEEIWAILSRDTHNRVKANLGRTRS